MNYSTGNRTILRLTLAVCSAALCLICAGIATPASDILSVNAPAGAVIRAASQARADAAVPDFPDPGTPADHLLTEKEMELLARVISAEARGESYDGQVAVGAVILNRLEHPDFPDSLKEVCYQPGAFDGVADGQIDITPSESCMLAAADAASGRDPTGGAVFFYNPDTASSLWIRSRQVVAVIGSHCFCV